MAATAAQAAPNGQAGAPDELGGTGDEVKEYFHEGEGENTEHLNSMDLHDIKTELEKDAEAEEVSAFAPTEHAAGTYTCGMACSIVAGREMVDRLVSFKHLVRIL